MGGITCIAEGFAGETGAVDVLEGGERDTNYLLSWSHYPLKGLAAGRVAGAIPHSDAASQNVRDPPQSVSSANLMNRLELCDGVQSWVSRVKRRGLSTHPWGGPVFSVMVLDVLMPTRTA